MAGNIQTGVPQLNSPMVISQTGVVTQPWYLFFLNLWSRTGGSSGGGANKGTYSGEMRGFGGPTLPLGWLLCDGSAVSRTDYSDLFAAIGTVWGVGDGVHTFTLPNLEGRNPIGAGGLFPLGQYGGTASVALTIANLASHTHSVIDPGHTHTFAGTPHLHTITDPGHLHTITDPGHLHTSEVAANNVTTGISAGGVTPGDTGNSVTGITINNNTTGITGTNTTTATGLNSTTTTGITLDDTGSGSSFSTLNPYAAIYWMVKT